MVSGKYKACVVGGASGGVTGGELLRLLLNHPGIELACATSREFKGEYIFRVHPNLRGGRTNLTFSDSTIDAILKKEVDVVFLALPHGRVLSGFQSSTRLD